MGHSSEKELSLRPAGAGPRAGGGEGRRSSFRWRLQCSQHKGFLRSRASRCGRDIKLCHVEQLKESRTVVFKYGKCCFEEKRLGLFQVNLDQGVDLPPSPRIRYPHSKWPTCQRKGSRSNHRRGRIDRLSKSLSSKEQRREVPWLHALPFSSQQPPPPVWFGHPV